ncbi:MAG: transposase [Deltaproteobacteria bacterium]|nr:transposase [Deltaproteobacteria bacterium]MBW2069811.1 transposase [Deltaproteobacteria bacterium]
MPRTARIDVPGLLHHVIIRGIERREIFRKDRDREDFIQRLEVLCPETKTSCYAWAFLSNHAHFLFRTGTVPLATLMRRLLTGYVIGFNRRHGRHGQLFQNRYKSIVCQEDAYLLELVRYLHLNPVRAGIVKTLDELKNYRYSGHSSLMGEIERQWQDNDYVLGYFARKKTQARIEYESYVEQGFRQGRRKELTGGGLIRSLGGWTEERKMLKDRDHVMSDERILGDPDFVDAVISQSEEQYERRYELRRRGYDLNRLAERVAEVLDMEPHEVFSRGRQVQKVKARSLLCFWAARELGISHTELARKLTMSLAGIGFSVQRGEAIARDGNYELLD